ncbi:MAG: rod shape-determining protein MreD [Mycobacteriales bacterium]|nr:rod shape-determining protein MreD [Frankia sp.]
MTASRVLLVVASLLTALVLQTTVFAWLPLFGARPNVVLVLVVCFALSDGPGVGTIVGFAAGLSVDLLSDHTLGLRALVYCVTGWAAGTVRAMIDRFSTTTPIIVVAAAAAVAEVAYAAFGALLGDPRAAFAPVARGLPFACLYDVILTPFVFSAVNALVRRTDLTERHW